MELQRLIEQLKECVAKGRIASFRIANETWVRTKYTGDIAVEVTWTFYDGRVAREFASFETLKKFVEAMLAFYNENDTMSVEQKIDVIYKECVGQTNVGN